MGRGVEGGGGQKEKGRGGEKGGGVSREGGIV